MTVYVVMFNGYLMSVWAYRLHAEQEAAALHKCTGGTYTVTPMEAQTVRTDW